MKWYPHYMGDYLRDTRDLTMVEHGAYRLLLDHYYSTEQPLSAIASILHRVCMAFASCEQEAIEKVLHRFFVLEEDGWHHKRVDDELVRCRKLSESRSRNAKKRWETGSCNSIEKNMQEHMHPQPYPQPHSKKKKTSLANDKKNRSPKVVSDTPLSDHAVFVKWWCVAFQTVTGKKYGMSGKDAKSVQKLLDLSGSLTNLVGISAHFLTMQDSWLDDAGRDLTMLVSKWNRMPSAGAIDYSMARGFGIVPPKGETFAEWWGGFCEP